MGYSRQFDSLADINEVDWAVMPANYFWGGDTEVRERRQAEFLVYDWSPWMAIEEIAVINQAVKDEVEAALAMSVHKPAVQIRPNWYY